MNKLKIAVAISLFLIALSLILRGRDTTAQGSKPREHQSVIGEESALRVHIKQSDIDRGKYTLPELLNIGESIFAARWTKLDGQGRPSANGGGTPSKRDRLRDPGFLRTSGTDSTSCADCHVQPTLGGAGGFVANVFVLAQELDPVTDSVGAEFSNERNTLGMNGSGAIEMLAREMTADLIAIRELARVNSKARGHRVTLPLTTKGINFGWISVRQGVVNTSQVVGVDTDLIIKPFHQKGVVNSVRVFTVNAYNHHHGMEAIERFGVGQKDNKGKIIASNDFDEDGIPDELSAGDITASTIFQAAMNIPGRLISSDHERRRAGERGKVLFSSIGCAECHVPSLPLDSRFFSEPNPFNPAGNLRPQDVRRPYSFDLTRDIPKPRLDPRGNRGATVEAFTDLKRHVICDRADPFFCNERLIQGSVPTNQFITRKLWDVGNTAPYGHRGDLTTITEAILHHSGEARQSRNRFNGLSKAERNELIEFLKQLQVLPVGSARVVTESDLHRFNARK